MAGVSDGSAVPPGLPCPPAPGRPSRMRSEMSEHARETGPTKTSATANELVRKTDGEPAETADKHFGSSAQRRISDAADNSDQVKQMRALQTAVDGPAQRQIG